MAALRGQRRWPGIWPVGGPGPGLPAL